MYGPKQHKFYKTSTYFSHQSGLNFSKVKLIKIWFRTKNTRLIWFRTKNCHFNWTSFTTNGAAFTVFFWVLIFPWACHAQAKLVLWARSFPQVSWFLTFAIPVYLIWDLLVP